MRIQIIYLYFLFILMMFQSCKKTSIETVSGTQLAVFNEAQHNAFTDLIKYNGNYYCVFREASTHDSYNGLLRVMQSYNGNSWQKFSLLSVGSKDLRDPHFFVDNNNVLSIGTSGRNRKEEHENIVFKLKNGSFIQSAADSLNNNYWLWSFTNSGNGIYSIGYNLKQSCFNSGGSNDPKIRLFLNTNTNGTNYINISPANWIDDSFKCPCEASMVFTNDSTLVTIVRDEHTEGLSHIGISKKPFQNWQWQTFPHFVRGPKLALLPNGKIFLAAASMVYYNKTYYAILNPSTFSVETIKAFPSGGDTGYPGVIIEGNTALVSYYSSHEGNTRIYINRIIY
jgi:hypothetical protein